MDECPHGMGDPGWCSVCKHGPSRPAVIRIEATFAARYPGQCGGCDLPITVGEVIHRLSTGAYLHQGCE